MFLVVNGMYITNGSCTETHKKIPIHYGQWEKIFKIAFLHVYDALNTMKLTVVIQVYLRMHCNAWMESF